VLHDGIADEILITKNTRQISYLCCFLYETIGLSFNWRTWW